MIVNRILFPQHHQYKNRSKNSCNNDRRKLLIKKYDIEPKYAKQFASFDDEHFNRVINLAEYGFNDNLISDLVCQKPKNFEKTIKLIKIGFNDNDLTKIIRFDEKQYKRLLRLEKNGIDFNSLFKFLNLSEQELKESIRLIKQGFYPSIAANLVKYNQEQRNIIIQLLSENVEIDDAVSIASMCEEDRLKYEIFRKKGINPSNSIILATMKDCHEQRTDELLAQNIDEDIITDFADLSESDYQKALGMLKDGVYPDYIKDIIYLNNSKTKDRQYERNINRGFSPTVSFVLAQFDNSELKALKELIKINPEIKPLLYENYDIILLTRQETDAVQSIFTKQFYTPDKTKITITKTFDENRNIIQSKTEEYTDHSTSSRLEKNSDIYKTKYDKFGQIRELTQYIKDAKTEEITGVLNYKASNILPGAYDCIYYDINKFNTDKNSIESIDYDIEKSVNMQGNILAVSGKNEDGSIFLDEKFTYNNYTTERHYKELKDFEGNIEYSSYKYSITDAQNNKILDTEREFKRDKSGKIINKINGVTYKINFDDKHKIISIGDGSKITTIKVSDKLSYYSKEQIWNGLKNLQADTILTLFNNINLWSYCENSNSEVFYTKNKNIPTNGNKNYTVKLITSEVPQTVMHECGHIKSYEQENILNDELLLQYYSEEMKEFEEKCPYNEQEFIGYFMPNAELYDVQGLSELVAECNIILSTYGDYSNESKTRSQFLVRYFPKTISRTAELLGKNSKESILS